MKKGKEKEKVADLWEGRKPIKKIFLHKVANSSRESGSASRLLNRSKEVIAATYQRASSIDGCSSSKRVRWADSAGFALTHTSHFTPEDLVSDATPPTELSHLTPEGSTQLLNLPLSLPPLARLSPLLLLLLLRSPLRKLCLPLFRPAASSTGIPTAPSLPPQLHAATTQGVSPSKEGASVVWGALTGPPVAASLSAA